MHLITCCSFNVNIFCLQSERLKDSQWHTLFFCILSFLNYMQLSLNESQNMMTGCFLPSIYFWFAKFKAQFNGNLLSGWKITLFYYVAMYIWNRMPDGNGNISHTLFDALSKASTFPSVWNHKREVAAANRRERHKATAVSSGGKSGQVGEI